jgi:invasion protein IalB
MAQRSHTGLRLAGALVFSMLAAASLAQDAPAPAPAQQQENWASRCVAPSRQAPLECSIEQRLIMQDTSRLVAAVTVRVPTDTGRPVMMLQMPLGLYLPAGITIDIDGTSEQRFELQTCDANGCYAGAPVPDQLLATMTRGQKLNLKFQNLNRQPITVSATLVGFTAAYQRIRP